MPPPLPTLLSLVLLLRVASGTTLPPRSATCHAESTLDFSFTGDRGRLVHLTLRPSSHRDADPHGLLALSRFCRRHQLSAKLCVQLADASEPLLQQHCNNDGMGGVRGGDAYEYVYSKHGIYIQTGDGGTKSGASAQHGLKLRPRTHLPPVLAQLFEPSVILPQPTSDEPSTFITSPLPAIPSTASSPERPPIVCAAPPGCDHFLSSYAITFTDFWLTVAALPHLRREIEYAVSLDWPGDAARFGSLTLEAMPARKLVWRRMTTATVRLRGLGVSVRRARTVPRPDKLSFKRPGLLRQPTHEQGCLLLGDLFALGLDWDLATSRDARLFQLQNAPRNHRNWLAHRPPNIVVLALESVTRAIVRRYMPRLSRLVDELRRPVGDGDAFAHNISDRSHAAFRFEAFHTAFPGGTVDNLVPLFTGRAYTNPHGTRQPWASKDGGTDEPILKANATNSDQCRAGVRIPVHKWLWRQLEEHGGYATFNGATYTVPWYASTCDDPTMDPIFLFDNAVPLLDARADGSNGAKTVFQAWTNETQCLGGYRFHEHQLRLWAQHLDFFSKRGQERTSRRNRGAAPTGMLHASGGCTRSLCVCCYTERCEVGK